MERCDEGGGGLPRVLPSVERKEPELLPWLEHPSRRVVLRAARLLCHAGGPEAPARLAALARRYPCEVELVAAAWALGAEVGNVPCVERADPLATAAVVLEARNQPAPADPAALERTLRRLDAFDPKQVREALASLARVDTAAGFLATLRGLGALLGKGFDAHVGGLLRGVLGAQLDRLASRGRVRRAEAFFLAAATTSPTDLELLEALARQGGLAEQTEAGEAAARARLAPGATAFGRAWLESKAKSDWMAVGNLLRRHHDHHDRPALRAYVKDPANLWADRARAAAHLAELGDATGLALWDSAEGLWPEERARRRKLLAELAGPATPEVRAAAQARLASW